MSEIVKKEFYLCPVTGLPHGEHVNLEDLVDGKFDEAMKEYEFKGIEYSKEVKKNIDKGLVALVVVENKIKPEDVQETDGVKFGSLNITNADRTGDYAFISKELFIKLFGSKEIQEMQFVSEEVMKGLLELQKIGKLGGKTINVNVSGE